MSLERQENISKATSQKTAIGLVSMALWWPELTQSMNKWFDLTLVERVYEHHCLTIGFVRRYFGICSIHTRHTPMSSNSPPANLPVGSLLDIYTAQ